MKTFINQVWSTSMTFSKYKSKLTGIQGAYNDYSPVKHGNITICLVPRGNKGNEELISNAPSMYRMLNHLKATIPFFRLFLSKEILHELDYLTKP